MQKFVFYSMFCSLFALISISSLAQRKVLTKSNRNSKTQTLRLIKVSGDQAIRIKSDITILPKAFEEHDLIALFNNLKYYLLEKDKEKNNESLDNFIKGKPLLGDLTTDDLFVFKIHPNQTPFGISRNDKNLRFSGELYRLYDKYKPPAPAAETEGCGGSDGLVSETRFVYSKDQLVTEVAQDIDLMDFWQKSVFHWRTVVPESNPKNYKGVVMWKGCKRYVPLTQSHYQIAFNNEQPFKLFWTKATNFFFDEYDYYEDEGAGLLVWLKDGVDGASKSDTGNPNALFIFKLVPPYANSETIKRYDKVERKWHRDFINRIYVDLLDIWIYDKDSGLINKKQKASK